jgi:hypothetical protein
MNPPILGETERRQVNSETETVSHRNYIMKQERDMDLIRLMLIAHVTGQEPPEMKEYDDRTVLYHYTLLKDADFIDANFADGNDVVPDAVANVRVKWKGHEFYDASKESKIWRTAKEQVIKQGASFTAAALLELLKIEVRKKLAGGP